MMRGCVSLLMSILLFMSPLAVAKAATPQEPPPVDWGILAFPALEPYNLIEFYLKWADAAQAALEETAQLGTTRVLIAKTWRELEPKNSQYNLKDLRHQAAAVRKLKQSIFFGLQLINTQKRELPEDLAEKSWADPILRSRVLAFLDKALPLLTDGRPLYVSFGNEVDVYFASRPEEVEAFCELFEAVRAHVRLNYPEVKLGITATDEGLRGDRPALITRLNRSTDVLMLTYYPTKDMKVMPPDSPRRDLPRMVAYAAGKPIVLQEVGYPSAVGVGSSPQAQADFIKEFFSAWERHRQAIPHINLFLQTDVGTRICDQWTGYYGFTAHRQLFADFICTLGLKDAYGNPKPAWQLLQNEIAPKLRRAP